MTRPLTIIGFVLLTTVSPALAADDSATVDLPPVANPTTGTAVSCVAQPSLETRRVILHETGHLGAEVACSSQISSLKVHSTITNENIMFGHVVENDGTPVKVGLITAIDQTTGSSGTVTAADGTYSVSVPPGTYEVLGDYDAYGNLQLSNGKTQLSPPREGVFSTWGPNTTVLNWEGWTSLFTVGAAGTTLAVRSFANRRDSILQTPPFEFSVQTDTGQEIRLHDPYGVHQPYITALTVQSVGAFLLPRRALAPVPARTGTLLVVSPPVAWTPVAPRINAFSSLSAPMRC